MSRVRKTILGIDWGSKYIGVAYSQEGNEVIFPIGYLLNDQMIYFNIADLMQKYHVGTIVLGWPSKQLDIQEKISKFIKTLELIIGDKEIVIHKMEEDYSSVQAGEIVSDTFKNIE